MLIFCTRCGEKQHSSGSSCFRCGSNLSQRTEIDPFERTKFRNSVQEGLDDSELDIFDFEEDISLPVRIYFALTNPWRKRWRRGLLWRIALVVMALALLAVLGYGSFWIWSELTKVEVNNLLRTISRY